MVPCSTRLAWRTRTSWTTSTMRQKRQSSSSKQDSILRQFWYVWYVCPHKFHCHYKGCAQISGWIYCLTVSLIYVAHECMAPLNQQKESHTRSFPLYCTVYVLILVYWYGHSLHHLIRGWSYSAYSYVCYIHFSGELMLKEGACMGL